MLDKKKSFKYDRHVGVKIDADDLFNFYKQV